jgi:hypothetical protein
MAVESSSGPLLAGYGVGMLLWIVTITPHQIGVVEGDIAAYRWECRASPPRWWCWLPLTLAFFVMRRLRLFKRLD